MSVVAVAVCPHPPLLVPQVAAAAAPELDQVRAACDEAVAAVLGEQPDDVVVVGHGGPHLTTMAAYGVDTLVSQWPLPLSLALGAWLLRGRPFRALAVDRQASAADCRALGATIAAEDGRLGLLVMADGSARRSPSAPGYVDQRAEIYDATVAAALRDGRPDALLALDPVLAADLLVAGRAAWQVLGGATTGGAWCARLLADVAPYGVGYLVACWLPLRQDVPAPSAPPSTAPPSTAPPSTAPPSTAPPPTAPPPTAPPPTAPTPPRH